MLILDVKLCIWFLFIINISVLLVNKQRWSGYIWLGLECTQNNWFLRSRRSYWEINIWHLPTWCTNNTLTTSSTWDTWFWFITTIIHYKDILSFTLSNLKIIFLISLNKYWRWHWILRVQIIVVWLVLPSLNIYWWHSSSHLCFRARLIWFTFWTRSNYRLLNTCYRWGQALIWLSIKPHRHNSLLLIWCLICWII